MKGKRILDSSPLSDKCSHSLKHGFHFYVARANRKTVLKLKCFKEAFLGGSRGPWLVGEDQQRMPLWRLGLSLWKLFNSWVRLSSLLISIKELPTFCYGSPVAIYGGWLKLSILEKTQKESQLSGFKMAPWIHLIWLALDSNKNDQLCFIDYSDWESLRSLNSFCHLTGEVLDSDGWGSRSQALRFRWRRSLWRLPLNGWVRRLERLHEKVISEVKEVWRGWLLP